MTDERWRAEADDEFVAERRSGLMAWLRRRFRIMGPVAGAFSHAETGPYAGAPRDPNLRVDDEKTYSAVRYTTNQVAYITTTTNPGECHRCGQPLVEKHEIEYVRDEDTHVPIGAVRTCRGCQADSWMLRSQMPATARARRTARRNVV